MAEFSLRRATEKDVPAFVTSSIVSLCKETIPEVYGPLIPPEVLRPWAEGSAVEKLVEEPWPRKTVDVAERWASIVDRLRFISSSRRGYR